MPLERTYNKSRRGKSEFERILRSLKKGQKKESYFCNTTRQLMSVSVEELVAPRKFNVLKQILAREAKLRGLIC